MDNPITQSELLTALDALILDDALPELAPDEITVGLVAGRASCGQQKAKRIIRDLVAAGKMRPVGRRKGGNGHAVDAWRLVTE